MILARPFVTSGVRIGTPSVTTQGMKQQEMAIIADLIARVLRHRADDAELAAVREDVAVLCGKFTPTHAERRRVPDLAGYAFVGFVAASSRRVTTPIVRRVALDFGWVVPPDDRRVHTEPTPAIGGVAMFLGLAAAMGAAWQMDHFSTLFDRNSEPLGVLLAPRDLPVGLVDDLRADLGAGQGDRDRRRRGDPDLVRRDDVLLPGPVLRRLLHRRRLGPAHHRRLVALHGQRGQPHRRPRRSGRGHRRHRPGTFFLYSQQLNDAGRL